MGARGQQAAPGTVPEVEEVRGPNKLLAVQLKMFIDAPRRQSKTTRELAS